MNRINYDKIPIFTEKSECILDKKSNLKLGRLYSKEGSKKYLKAIAIILGNKIICDDFCDSILFKEELSHFDSLDDSDNEYFKFSYKTVKNIKSKKLVLSFDNQEICFSKAKAKAIVNQFNMCLAGFSCVILPENISYIKLSEETMVTALDLSH